VKRLVDMNLSPRWVEMLSAAGFSAAHWSSVGAAAASDCIIMAWAAANDHVVLTHDLDFSAILAATHGAKPSVVQIRADNLSPSAIADQLIAALRQIQDELRAGALLTVDAHRTRLTLLPLASTTP
jgi:predicted nuclease of predicted toxin-antitoxin system